MSTAAVTSQAKRSQPANRGGLGGAAPALLDTRDYLNTQVAKPPSGRKFSPDSIGIAETANQPETHLENRPKRWERWSEEAHELGQYRLEKLATAYDHLGRELRAASVIFCGFARVQYSPDGSMLRNPTTGVPLAFVMRCGSRWCPVECAATRARKQRATVLERLIEVRTRRDLIGPLWQPSARFEEDEHARVQRFNDTATDALDDVALSQLIGDMPVERPARQRRGRIIRPRAQRRPMRNAFCASARSARFNIGPPSTTNGYGCRLITLTQPDRPGENLRDGLDRLENALSRLVRSQVWQAHVDGALIRIEFELSTPKKRQQRAAEKRASGDVDGARELLSRSTWGSAWHVHAHVLAWGRQWTQRPHPRIPWVCPSACRCTRCQGVDDEDSLLLCWRRAMVSTGLYARELGAQGIDQTALLANMRKHAHASRRTWARPLLGDGLVDVRTGESIRAVRFGGARIETPRRQKRATGERISGWGAICEVVKYSTKPAVLADLPVARIGEVIQATDHRRLIRATGFLFGVHMHEDESEEISREECEGAERVEGAGLVGVDEFGRSWTDDEFVERCDDDAQRERRQHMQRVNNAHVERRATRAATGPPREVFA